MHAVVKTTMILLATTLAGCAGNHRPHSAAMPAEALAGDYRLAGSVAGRRIAVAIRFDSTGRAFVLPGSSPAGAFECESRQWVNDLELQLGCGSVQLRLAVANGSLATKGTISFDVPTTARGTNSLAKSDGCAVARRCVDPSGVRCDLSASSHGSSPPFVWRAAEKQRCACAQDGASPPPHRNR